MSNIDTEIIKITDIDKQAQDISRIGKALCRGALAAFPTETVYGLGANALDEGAVAGIFKAKGRPQDNPLIIHIPSAEWLPLYCIDIPDTAGLLADTFWPGPLTLIMKKAGVIPETVTAGLDTVAVRCPSHPVAKALIEAAGVPVAAPSANRSGRPSTTAVSHVIEDLNGLVDFIIDGGDCGVGVESTTIDLTVSPPRILRPGGVTAEQLRAVLGEVSLDAGLTGMLIEGETPRSPGMKYRHYAPKASLTAICGEAEKSAGYILKTAHTGDGILCYEDFAYAFHGFEHVITYGASGDPAGQAHRLFAALRAFDSTPVTAIYAQCPSEEGIGLAVSNRLKKAAGFKVVYPK